MTPLDLAHSLDTAGKTCKMVKLLQKAKVQHGAGRGRGQLPQNTAPLRQRGTPAHHRQPDRILARTTGRARAGTADSPHSKSKHRKLAAE